MLEKPDLSEESILACLSEAYGLQATGLTFLPLGADINTAVYRAVTAGGTVYFLKLRKGFEEISVTVPAFLKAQGIQPLIAALETRTGRLWADFNEFKMILYPFIEGQNGYTVELPEEDWPLFGAALKGIHTAPIPPALSRMIPRESWSPRWREMVRSFQAQAAATTFEDPAAVKLAAFMNEKRDAIDHLVDRADQLARALQAQPLELVVCHADIHAGNLLIGADGTFYIVDWDNPILAPKERDLMFISSGAAWNSPRLKALFYQGYGPAEIHMQALAYYRYERIVQDVAAFCEQLLASAEGGKDREQSYLWFTGQFLPGQEVEIACQTDLGWAL